MSNGSRSFQGSSKSLKVVGGVRKRWRRDGVLLVLGFMEDFRREGRFVGASLPLGPELKRRINFPLRKEVIFPGLDS